MSVTEPDHRIPATPRALPATEVLMGRIGWLFRLRWAAIGGSVLCIEFARRVLPIHVFPVPLYAVLAVLALYNVIVGLTLQAMRRAGIAEDAPPSASDAAQAARAARPIGALARFLLPRTPPGVAYYDWRAARAAVSASVQIAIDLVLLVLLLHFAGGIENPVRVFFVFHVIIASVLLSGQATVAVASLGLALISGLAIAELCGALPHYPLDAHWRAGGYTVPGLVIPQLFLLGVTLFAAAYLASSIAARLRRREIDVVVLSRHLEEKAEHLEHAYAKLSAEERSKSHYMRKVAHEIRGPLGTIHTALTVALPLLPDGTNRQARDLIERAERRAGELAVVTKELLALTRARAPQAIAEMTRLDPGAVARTVLDELEAAAENAGLQLIAAVDPHTPEIVADPEGLRDLFANLLSNAVRYTPRGGTVRFSLRDDRGRLSVEVEDSGIGIPEADLSRVFEEFFRSKNARERVADGSGLGMAIVKAVVDQHRGTIRVESQVGQGTRVRVELPLSPA